MADDAVIRESGFVVLEDCEVKLSGRNANGEVDSLHALESKCLRKWIEVDIKSPGPSNADILEGIRSGPEESCSDQIEETCSHCFMALHVEVDRNGSTNGDLAVRACSPTDRLPRFDGTIQDMAPDPSLCRCRQKLRQRTDAALGLGLVLSSMDLGHVHIQRLLIRFHSREYQIQDSRVHPNLMRTNSIKVDIAITFSVTEMSPSIATIQSKSVKMKRAELRNFFSSSPKPLPYATQALLSIMRSDWNFLERLLNGLRNENRAIRRSKSIFPPKLSLDEVYQRVQATASDQFALDRSSQLPSYENHDIFCLPPDVLVYQVGSFLKSKSLDSLRCSSKFFYTILRGVVPGLKLKLYTHQKNSLAWMRLRETQLISEKDLDSEADSDTHRMASGGATVLLRRNLSTDDTCTRISQYNGEEVKLRHDDPLSRKVARGGLLCDDPGLGKTITVIALLLQTIGLSTESLEQYRQSDSDVPTQENLDEQIFKEYWREQSIPQYRSQSLRKLLFGFIRAHANTHIFLMPVDPVEDGVPDYFDVIQKPICLRDIQQRIESFQYDSNFDSFQADVILCFRNATTYHPVGSPIYELAVKLETDFMAAVKDFKENQVQIAKKSFGRASSKPNSSVAVLVEQNNQMKLEQALTTSSGTLLVVPSVLLEHWQDQFRLHVDLAYFSSKKAIVFEFTGTAENALKMEEIVRKCKVDQTHAPFLFVDKSGTRRLPFPQFLAMFTIVLTSNQRFTNEWKNGSFEEELRQQNDSALEAQGFSTYSKTSLAESEEACPLLKVKWLRMIVDEGHSMGRGRENSAIAFASWISAQRRWAMTGTPTRQTVSESGLSSILNLMQFLQHDFFSRRQDGESVWQNLITRGWARGSVASFFRIQSLLSLLMVRHTKGDIKELPAPEFRSTVLSMSHEETKTYNTLVCAVQSNLLITSMEGKTSGLQDSLLHRSQTRHARDALRNVRLVCSGGTQVIPTITKQFWTEFLADFEECNDDAEMLVKMREYLFKATTEQVSPCDCCGIHLTTLLVFPCGHLVCTECVDHRSSECIVCDKTFDIDLFQRLQPGMDYQWLYNLEEEKKQKKQKGNVTMDASAPSPTGTSLLEDGSAVLVPSIAIPERRRTAKPGDGHTCSYSLRYPNGECERCWKEHDACNLTTGSKRCKVCYRRAEPCPEFETKPFYIVQKLERLVESQQKYDEQNTFSRRFLVTKGLSTRRRRVKVIVFSQFRKVLNTTGDRLIRRFGTACIAEYWGKFRRNELNKFIHDDDCFCMLLGKDGSEGLDLSFVTHVIFVEQVWDKSLEQQVVARAWRMGAKGHVEVETLIAQDSVEETMLRLETFLETGELQSGREEQGIQSASEAGKTSEYQRAKLQYLLKGLRLITNSTTNPLVAMSTTSKRNLPVSVELRGQKATKRQRVRFQE